MKKKNVLATLLVSAMLATMLVGCGSKETETAVETEVTAEEETEAVVEEETAEAETEVTEEETTTEEEVTEATEEVTEADFFAENGLTVVAPADVTTFNGRFRGTDDTVAMNCTVEMTETSATTTEFVWTVDGKIVSDEVDEETPFDYDWGIDIFDRASGVSFTSADYKTGDTATGEAFTVPLNDTETIDVSYEFEQTNSEDKIMTVKMTFVHPEGYDKAVFAIWGSGLKEQSVPVCNNLADALSTGAIPADATYIAIQ